MTHWLTTAAKKTSLVESMVKQAMAPIYPSCLMRPCRPNSFGSFANRAANSTATQPLGSRPGHLRRSFESPVVGRWFLLKRRMLAGRQKPSPCTEKAKESP